MTIAWTHANESISLRTQQHATICPCPCIPAICMYVYAYAHKPTWLLTMSPRSISRMKKNWKNNNSPILSYCPCHVTTLAPYPSPPPRFPHHAHLFALVVPHCFTFVSSFFCHMFGLGKYFWDVGLVFGKLVRHTPPSTFLPKVVVFFVFFSHTYLLVFMIFFAKYCDFSQHRHQHHHHVLHCIPYGPTHHNTI